jgi:hypothetical protein
VLKSKLFDSSSIIEITILEDLPCVEFVKLVHELVVGDDIFLLVLDGAEQLKLGGAVCDEPHLADFLVNLNVFLEHCVQVHQVDILIQS